MGFEYFWIQLFWQSAQELICWYSILLHIGAKMTETIEQAGDAPQLTCKFVTKLPEELRVPEAALVGSWEFRKIIRGCMSYPRNVVSLTSHPPLYHQAVPSNLTRYGLSQIINHLLELGTLEVYI